MWRPYGRRGDPTGSAPQGGGLGGVVGVLGAPWGLRPTEATGVDVVPRNPGPRCQEGPRLPESRSRDSKAPQSFVSPSLEIVAPGTLQGAPASEARALREGVDPRPQRTAPGARIQARRPRRGARRAQGDGVAQGAGRRARGAGLGARGSGLGALGAGARGSARAARRARRKHPGRRGRPGCRGRGARRRARRARREALGGWAQGSTHAARGAARHDRKTQGPRAPREECEPLAQGKGCPSAARSCGSMQKAIL